MIHIHCRRFCKDIEIFVGKNVFLIFLYTHTHSHYIQDCHRGIDDWEVTLFEKCETHKQLKEMETFWQHELKLFALLAKMKEKNIYFNHT